jgi:chaperonin GroEL (HSP60 family)
MLVEMENCRVLVSDQKIEQMKDIIPVLEQITRQNQPLLIVTEDITGTLCTLHFATRSLHLQSDTEACCWANMSMVS